MKNNLSISVPQPCSEKWENFTPQQTGGFCASCSTTVVDFTRMSDEQVLAYFSKKESHSCGRFRMDQLKIYSYGTPPKVTPGLTLLKASLLSLLLMMAKQGAAQSLESKPATTVTQHPTDTRHARLTMNIDQTVRGVVRDETGPLPGINVVLKGTTEGTITNAEGQFEFPRKLKEGDILIFSFIGLETKEYVVPRNTGGLIEVPMTVDVSMTMCDLVMMGKIAFDGVYEEKPSGVKRVWLKIKDLF